jgi:prepilin-type N-terminal cleavage/methylation domain-containing protein
MKTFHDRRGFTLVELMVTVAIMGVVVAIAMPAMTSYKRKEDARSAARDISGVITNARSQAIASGRMTFLLFGEPGNGLFPFEAGQIAALVRDDNGDNNLTADDVAVPIRLRAGINPEVSLYGVRGTPLETTAIPADDLSTDEADGTLASLTDGSTLPVTVGFDVPVVGFTPQGSPVRLLDVGPPWVDNWGTGAGGVYVTDNRDVVLGVFLMPLGAVSVRKLDVASGEWR